MNVLLILSLAFVIFVAVATYDSQETSDAISGATTTNDVMDAIASVSDEHEGDDD